MSKMKGLAEWLPAKKWANKEPDNLEELFAKYAEEDNFFGVSHESYMQGIAELTVAIVKDTYGQAKTK